MPEIIEQLEEYQKELEVFKNPIAGQMDEKAFSEFISIHVYGFISQTPALLKEFNKRAGYYSQFCSSAEYKREIQSLNDAFIELYSQWELYGIADKETINKILDRETFFPFDYERPEIEKALECLNNNFKQAGELFEMTCIYEVLKSKYNKALVFLVKNLQNRPIQLYTDTFRNFYLYCLSKLYYYEQGSKSFSRITNGKILSTNDFERQCELLKITDTVLRQLKFSYKRRKKIKMHLIKPDSRVIYNEKVVNFPDSEFKIILKLAQNAQNNVSIQELALYNDDDAKANARNYIARVNKKFNSLFGIKFIHNQPKKGYYIEFSEDEILIQ